MCDIKYTDYGGYDTVPASDLKQIRTDFLTLPFQVIGSWITDIDARFNVSFSLRDFPGFDTKSWYTIGCSWPARTRNFGLRYLIGSVFRKIWFPFCFQLPWILFSCPIRCRHELEIRIRFEKFTLTRVRLSDLGLHSDASQYQWNEADPCLSSSGSATMLNIGFSLKEMTLFTLNTFRIQSDMIYSWCYGLTAWICILRSRVSDPYPDPHGSALIWAAGSGSAYKLRIRIHEGLKMTPKNRKRTEL